MQPKQKLNLALYVNEDVKDLDDLTLRNIIYQVYGEWNSIYTRDDLETIGMDALSEEADNIAQAEADKFIEFHHGG